MLNFIGQCFMSVTFQVTDFTQEMPWFYYCYWAGMNIVFDHIFYWNNAEFACVIKA